MKVILHIGAHRTGTTSFQTVMRKRCRSGVDPSVGFWGPMRTRKGLFTGIQPTPGLGKSASRRARGRILLQMEKARQAGVKTLIVSDENMMGMPGLNLRTGHLYSDVGERLARHVAAFDGHVNKVVLSVRAQDHYWTSLAAFAITRGHNVPDAAQAGRMVHSPRTWRDVIADVACAAPDAKIEVTPFETTMGRADTVLGVCLGHRVDDAGEGEWLNRRPETGALRNILADRGENPDQIPADALRWSPFDETARATLREVYADDMHWLVAGANGLATLTEELDHTRAGHTPPIGPLNRGQGHDIEERRMAHPR
ncbi:hypothetical protein [uncultured Tateyamaria sp.]|uniref:hypothetical protein n=1 Tax=uncultured Tateyamaria sp. TaxID=455651 RepID=UPI002604862A|nr:hypothetical protein [uncultured Tateyamaria sp.]